MEIGDDKLNRALRSMIRKHGLSRVQRSLSEIASSETRHDIQQAVPSTRIEGTASPPKKRSRSTASDYVGRMDLPLGTSEAVHELARRFEDRSFLPTLADIRNFCRFHRIDAPDPKSRVNAVPRVFDFISTMGPREIKKLVDYSMFSGPSRLAPIADAIRKRSRSPQIRDAPSTASISSSSSESDRSEGVSERDSLSES